MAVQRKELMKTTKTNREPSRGGIPWLLLAPTLCGAVWLAIAQANAAAPPAVPDSAQAANPPRLEVIDPRLVNAVGPVDIIVRLDDLPLAAAHPQDAKRTGAWLTPAQQRAHLGQLRPKQDAVAAKARALGGVELGRMSKALNAVALRIDAAELPALTAHTNIIAIRPVQNYRLDLSETVPYVGATAVQTAGFDGTGVKVAVIDSGVDYTHRNLGGAGTLAAYAAAYGASTGDPRNTTLDGLFPTAKVIGGFDFVGESWPDGPLAPDPDPIDFEGHGTHVADIIAGQSLDGIHKGVAPGAKIYAIRACSSVASACSGVALLMSMDFALDPNGDDDLSDAVDVINMSLGNDYGQKEDDLSAASAVAVHLGVIVVASAGNGGDKPYVHGSPASTPEVISVAQTQVPGAKRYPLVFNSPTGIAGQYPNTEALGWAPIGIGFTGDIVYIGEGCAADPYLEDPNGKVALIDRGACAASLKVDRAAKAGAIAVLIAMVNDSDPIAFSYGGGDTFVPTLVISKTVADSIKANLGAPVNVTVSPSIFVPLAGSMASSSSRGPSVSYNAIKPDIAAPGASMSAQVGTGTGETAFGGTSGAAPMVSGCVALLVQAFPGRSPAEIKALLMDTAETGIQTDPAKLPGVLAPVTRIGGGEVRVDRALRSTTAAWDKKERTGSLSFGYQALSAPATFTRTVVVRNYSNKKRTYSIASEFRYADDAATGAVSVRTPKKVQIAPHGSEEFEVKLSVDPSKLPDWQLNGGFFGGDGALLQVFEVDGYVRLTDGTDAVHVAWHVLPHKAAAVSAELNNSSDERSARTTLRLENKQGAVNGRVEVFSLTGQSPPIPRSLLPGPGDAFAVVDLLAVGVRLVDLGGEPGVQFAFNTRGERAHPNYPAEFGVYLDTNLDGKPDFAVFNFEEGGFGATGQNTVGVYNLETGNQTAFFYTDADLNSANAILTAPLSAIGLTPGSQFKFSAYALDNYFTGLVTDVIGNMTYTLGTPAFAVEGGTTFSVAPGTKTALKVSAVPGGTVASPSQSGLLLLYRDALPRHEAESIKLTGHREH